jgi:hypothetical protein
MYPPEHNHPQRKRKPRRLSTPIVFVIFLLVAIVAGLGVFALYTATKETVAGASNAADQFLTLMKTHDFANASASLTPIAQQRTPVQSLKNLEGIVEENHGTIISWGTPSWKIERNDGSTIVRLEYTLRCSKSPSAVEVVVERTGSTYQVYSFNYQL